MRSDENNRKLLTYMPGRPVVAAAATPVVLSRTNMGMGIYEAGGMIISV